MSLGSRSTKLAAVCALALMVSAPAFSQVKPPAAPDLVVIKTSDATAPVSPGDLVTFTLDYSNNGWADATGVSLVDPLPAGLSFVSANPSANLNGSQVSWGLGTLAMGASGTSTLTVQVDPGVSGDLVNTAFIVENESDVDPTDNQGSATVTVAGSADLALTKTSDAAGTVYPGDQFTYTMNVTNNGPADATAVEVTDTLPAQVAYVSDTCGGTESAGTWTWALGALANGASATCDVVVEVVPGANGPIVNTASVAAA